MGRHVGNLDQVSKRHDCIYCFLYRSRSDSRCTHFFLSRLIDGELLDVDFEPDPEENLEEVVKVLEKCDDSGLLNRYGIWVTQRDAERGVKILTRKTSKRPTQQPQSSINSTEDHTATLNRLRGVDPGAAEAFLEHMVLSRKQQVPDLHAELVELLLNRVLGGLKDEETRKAMLEIGEFFEGIGRVEDNLFFIEGSFFDSGIPISFICFRTRLLSGSLRRVFRGSSSSARFLSCTRRTEAPSQTSGSRLSVLRVQSRSGETEAEYDSSRFECF